MCVRADGRRGSAPLTDVETTAEIVATGNKTDLPTGAPIPLADMTPTVEITPGTEIIDGIPFLFEKVTGGEIHPTLVIKLPEQGVLVAQDVVHHHTHLWFLDRDFDGWQANIDRFAAETEYITILPGHGEPTDPAVWAELTDYVNAGRQLLSDDGDAYKKAVTARYPTYRGAALIDVANAYMLDPRGLTTATLPRHSPTRRSLKWLEEPLFTRLSSRRGRRRQVRLPPHPVDDGWARAELAFRELPDVRGLLSMGATVEVLHPPEARAELTAVATELAALHGMWT